MTITLVLGGARSGKSRHAQLIAESAGGPLVFIATAEPFDEEMTARIARHQGDRGPRWRTEEAPVNLPGAIHDHGREGATLLIDCVTVWLGNLMHHDHDIDAACDALVMALEAAQGDAIIVANEVGLALVPETAMGRRFRDAAGILNQRLAALADRVDLVVAGLAMPIRNGARDHMPDRPARPSGG